MIKKFLFVSVWGLLVLFLVLISFQYRSNSDAMVAVVESQVTAISYQKPVVVERLFVVPGQEVTKGDTLVIVSRPDLGLEIDKKLNELEQLQSEKRQEEQGYLSQKALLRIETEDKLYRLSVEKSELAIELEQQLLIEKQLQGLMAYKKTKTSLSDSLLKIRINSIDREMQELQRYKQNQAARLLTGLNDRIELLDKRMEILRTELNSLKSEYSFLVRRASFNGIVGNVNVQLDELVPPFTTIVSVYEERPTLIKAYINESLTYQVKPKDMVSVVSENRKYSVDGIVQELGARITRYPVEIQRDPQLVSYGQEVFIRIAPTNHFLNGEKVYVYPKSEK